MNNTPQDSNVESVRRKLAERAALGLNKYGVTTERTDLSILDWLTHHQQELMDACVYVERLIRDEEVRLRQSLPPNQHFDPMTYEGEITYVTGDKTQQNSLALKRKLENQP